MAAASASAELQLVKGVERMTPRAIWYVLLPWGAYHNLDPRARAESIRPEHRELAQALLGPQDELVAITAEDFFSLRQNVAELVAAFNVLPREWDYLSVGRFDLFTYDNHQAARDMFRPAAQVLKRLGARDAYSQLAIASMTALYRWAVAAEPKDKQQRTQQALTILRQELPGFIQALQVSASRGYSQYTDPQVWGEHAGLAERVTKCFDHTSTPAFYSGWPELAQGTAMAAQVVGNPFLDEQPGRPGLSARDLALMGIRPAESHGLTL